MTRPGPLVLVGAPRSGASALLWALGEHPDIRPVQDGAWLSPLVGGLEAAWQATAAHARHGRRRRASRAEFFSGFGPAAEARLADRGLPVVESWTLSDRLPGVLALFPRARVVHVVRDAADAAAAMCGQPIADGACFTPATAWRAWAACTEAALAAERAYGGEVVLRLRRQELLDDPGGMVERVLRHAGLAAAGRGTVRSLTTTSVCRPPAVDPPDEATARRVARLTRELSSTAAGGVPDDAVRQRIEAGLSAQMLGAGSAMDPRATLRGLVEAAVPDSAVVAVISKGDERLLTAAGRECWHFPRAANGEYSGFHPEDGNEAVRLLKQVQAEGASHLVVPAASAWWCEHYREFARYLSAHARQVGYLEGVASVHELGGSGGG